MGGVRGRMFGDDGSSNSWTRGLGTVAELQGSMAESVMGLHVEGRDVDYAVVEGVDGGRRIAAEDK